MLQADGITYEIETQDGPLKLLDNVSFNVPKGHFMAVVGPSGCGKTTLLKAIAGMIAETDGRFFWNGHDLAEEDFEPTEIGFVPQFSIAYDQLSVDENVESAAKLRCKFESLDDLDDSIDNALEVTGMEGIADRDVKILSGGQKRRLALAMELVSNPRLLICDEVTSGLDPRSEHDIVNLLHEVSRSDGRIVISVTHSLAHLDRYDSILVMHQGCVAYHGSPKTILHYFGVSALEEIYPKLQDRNGVSWCRSWAKHRESYYARLEKEREQKMLSGELPDPNAGPTDEQKEGTSTPAGEADGEGISSERASSGKETAAASETGEEAIPEVPGFFTQFFCLLGRRWRIFFRDRSQLVLQLVMVLLFPILVAMFTDKGTGQIVGLSATQDVQTLQKDIEAQQLNMKTGSAVSGREDARTASTGSGAALAAEGAACVARTHAERRNAAAASMPVQTGMRRKFRMETIRASSGRFAKALQRQEDRCCRCATERSVRAYCFLKPDPSTDSTFSSHASSMSRLASTTIPHTSGFQKCTHRQTVSSSFRRQSFRRTCASS